MRITIPVSGDGDAWMSHMPEFETDGDALVTDGRLDYVKVVEMFKAGNELNERKFGRPMFTFGSGDGMATMAITVEMLRQLTAVTHYLEGRADSTAHVAANGSAQDARLERRMAHGKVAFCRIDVKKIAGGVVFTVSHGSPKGWKIGIGNCVGGAREFAIYVLRVLANMAERVNDAFRDDGQTLRMFVKATEEGLVEEARERDMAGREADRVRAANERRETCERRRNGYCSPVCPTCRCYRAGRCEEAKI